ncbi:hypothetical protein BT93_E2103 [Corymbia citriodora subsp. variegata]|nr:hypothetical protein BT93_E2103 [Corymbia citriodora subsp. variegata]
MGLGAKAWTATILPLLILSLTFGPTWSMPFLILSGLIVSAVFVIVEKCCGNPAHAADGSAPDKNDALASAADDSTSDTGTVVINIPDLTDAARNSESFSSSSSLSRFKYDVYLNFRDSDIGHGFADHLYRQLDDAGIRVFSDEYDLTPGKEIWPEMKGAIEQSKISITIFSANFASSKSCLNELVQMWDCRERNGQIIIPIFYHVRPPDVRHLKGNFGESFDMSRHRDLDPAIQNWKQVLRQISNLNGFAWERGNGPEGRFIKKVVARVEQLLKEDYRFVNDKLVGIDHHVQEMMRKLGVAYHKGQATEVQDKEEQVIGICGEQGVGKTTLAKTVFYKIRKLFNAHCFLEDNMPDGVQLSRQRLIANLKKQIPAPQESSVEEAEEISSLCRDKKVLIVLDGLGKGEQIKALAGKLTWFGLGSKIIVTTNKNEVLNAFDDVGAVQKHLVKKMDPRHAHELFCKHAFQGDAAQDVSKYFRLSLDIAEAIGGLPSEIVHQASSLREEMNMTRWETTLNILRERRKK